MTEELVHMPDRALVHIHQSLQDTLDKRTLTDAFIFMYREADNGELTMQAYVPQEELAGAVIALFIRVHDSALQQHTLKQLEHYIQHGKLAPVVDLAGREIV